MWYKAARKKKMIIMRGISGSGKSTKARALGESGVVLGSDDFWGPEYNFDKSKIGEAHQWNQMRVLDALQKGISPIVVDNTNVAMYEIRPYVEMAIKHDYEIDFQEPETSWKFDAEQLAKRNQHNVPIDVIESMLERWDADFTIDDVLKSRAPWETNEQHEGDDIKSF